MDNRMDTMKKQVREWINLGYIAPEDIPSIELYMDQVTTFMDKHLSKNKRTDEDKNLTKTMINNYSKNNLLPPSNKKRYSKEHIILLIFIYYLKNVVTINDIQVMLTPLIDNFFDNKDAAYSMEEIYTNLCELEKRQYFNTENSIARTLKLVERDFPGSEDEYLKKLMFLSLLGYDIFMRKRLMEHMIDDMAADMKEKDVKEQDTKAKKEAKKDVKKETRKEVKKENKK